MLRVTWFFSLYFRSSGSNNRLQTFNVKWLVLLTLILLRYPFVASPVLNLFTLLDIMVVLRLCFVVSLFLYHSALKNRQTDTRFKQPLNTSREKNFFQGVWKCSCCCYASILVCLCLFLCFVIIMCLSADALCLFLFYFRHVCFIMLDVLQADLTMFRSHVVKFDVLQVEKNKPLTNQG